MQNQEQTDKKELTPIQQKREQLKELSAELRAEMDEGDKLNDLIIDRYKEDNPNILDFNTYKGWRKEGYQVKKGETAFVVWGRPKDKQEGEEAPEDDESGKFFPLAYIFSNLQVRPIEKAA